MAAGIKELISKAYMSMTSLIAIFKRVEAAYL